jgi:aldose 1-epimerase
MPATPEVVPFGTLSEPDASGRHPVDLVPLHSSALSVGILTYGAALWTVEAPDRHGHREHVALHLPTLADAEDRDRNPYLGATCGRVANRIAGASFPLDGETVEVEANEGPNQLHGGPDGFDRRIWDIAEVVANDDGGRVVLALVSPDGDQGFPGTLEITATYELHGHVLRLTYEALAHAPTVVNLTNHAYWNLAGPSRWDIDGSVGDHELRLPGERYLPVDAAAIPQGSLTSVAGTAADLRQARPLDDVLAELDRGIDWSYEVPDPGDEERAAFDGLRFAAELHHPTSGRTLTVATDQPAVQVYTGNWLGPPFAAQASVCLETQHWPDAPNRPDLGSVVLRPGEHRRSTTELTFGTR